MCVFSAGNVGNIPKKNKNPNIWRGKKKTLVKGSAGASKHVCKFSGSYLSKTTWTLDSEGIWADKLEPACIALVQSPSSEYHDAVHLLSLLIVVVAVVLCSHFVITHRYNAVRGQRTGSYEYNSGVEDYLRRETNKNKIVHTITEINRNKQCLGASLFRIA